ncbi:MAG: hypothetical protein ACFFE2_01415 [Candidatus Thorarchaeota archaeon]
MRAKGKSQRLSHLIPKFHFCSVPLFREEPLINWTYTDAVLFTAYDVYRSHDFWLDKVVSSGATLKEALVDLGFPKANSLVVDTGVFEMEAKKAGISRDLGIDIDIELTNAQIFEAYELSGADFYVAPDEIILPLDSPEVTNRKIKIIKSNLLELLEMIPAPQIISVVQGHQQEVVNDLLDFYRENGIRYFAIGGVIPLYHFDKQLLEKHLDYVRMSTRNEWLHIFGLPSISLLSYYLQRVRVDSVDTSTITYLTARRKYLVGLKSEPIRLADFEECSCPGCHVLSRETSSRSKAFFANLYIHNILTATRESMRKYNPIPTMPKQKKTVKRSAGNWETPIDNGNSDWKTAEEAIQDRERRQSV